MIRKLVEYSSSSEEEFEETVQHVLQSKRLKTTCNDIASQHVIEKEIDEKEPQKENVASPPVIEKQAADNEPKIKESPAKQKLFVCEQCGKAFSRKANMERHRDVSCGKEKKEKITSFPCGLCPVICSSISTANRHQRNFHPAKVIIKVDFIEELCKKGLTKIAEKIMLNLELKSLQAAAKASKQWWKVFLDGLIWKRIDRPDRNCEIVNPSKQNDISQGPVYTDYNNSGPKSHCFDGEIYQENCVDCIEPTRIIGGADVIEQTEQFEPEPFTFHMIVRPYNRKSI